MQEELHGLVPVRTVRCIMSSWLEPESWLLLCGDDPSTWLHFSTIKLGKCFFTHSADNLAIVVVSQWQGLVRWTPCSCSSKCMLEEPRLLLHSENLRCRCVQCGLHSVMLDGDNNPVKSQTAKPKISNAGPLPCSHPILPAV